MSVLNLQPFAANNNLILLSPAQIDGCIDMASDGILAHIDTELSLALLHQLVYAIAAAAGNNLSINNPDLPKDQQVAIYVAPLQTLDQACGLTALAGDAQ